MTMPTLQRNSQNIQLSMFQKMNEKRKNQSCNKNKIYISRDENERSFNYDDSFVRLNFRKHCNLNRKKYKTKNKQIVEKALFQRIRNILSKIKKQHESIREKKMFRKFFER